VPHFSESISRFGRCFTHSSYLCWCLDDNQ